MFSKVLVANRGEISVRVQQTLQGMGIRTVAVYAEPDRDAPHVRMADEAYSLNGTTAAETYLDAKKLVSVASKAGCDAVHPGYGFLSENPAFARSCGKAGCVFIGPTPEVMEVLGNKARSKEIAKAAGVPTVPGMPVLADGPTFEQIAERIGLPVLVKAVAGGGGRGQRLVNSFAELRQAVESASREALAAVADGRVLIEKWLPTARHIEVQVLVDSFGTAAHVFERECSIQRRRQKLLEETPAPGVSPGVRQKLLQAALDIMRAASYRNAGTVEFLVVPDESFYFLEVNTRIQVEHPITEAVTGLDLVREQLRIAAGEPLSTGVTQARRRGNAIECRVYAEDPYQSFAPSAGRLLRWRPPSGPGIRVDSGVAEGMDVTTSYDSLLAKVITWAEDRPAALARMAWALRHLEVLGVTTTAPFLASLLEDPHIVKAGYHTRFLDENPEVFQPPAQAAHLRPLAVALAGLSKAAGAKIPPPGSRTRKKSPWAEGGPWRLG